MCCVARTRCLPSLAFMSLPRRNYSRSAFCSPKARQELFEHAQCLGTGNMNSSQRGLYLDLLLRSDCVKCRGKTPKWAARRCFKAPLGAKHCEGCSRPSESSAWGRSCQWVANRHFISRVIFWARVGPLGGWGSTSGNFWISWNTRWDRLPLS